MSEAARTDIFVEDRAHEEFVCALLRRLAQEHGMALDMQVRSARGGHGRVLAELGVYQASVRRGILGLAIPDMLVVAIDANCKKVSAARREIREKLQRGFESLTAIACPAPHIERWYMADPPSFLEVVGTRPNVGRRKCQKDRYKKMLREAISGLRHASPLASGLTGMPSLASRAAGRPPKPAPPPASSNRLTLRSGKPYITYEKQRPTSCARVCSGFDSTLDKALGRSAASHSFPSELAVRTPRSVGCSPWSRFS